MGNRPPATGTGGRLIAMQTDVAETVPGSPEAAAAAAAGAGVWNETWAGALDSGGPGAVMSGAVLPGAVTLSVGSA